MADEWASYRERVVPANAPPVQAQESRRAFYAGAQAMFHLFQAAASDAGSEATDADVERVEALYQELEQFCADVKEGRA